VGFPHLPYHLEGVTGYRPAQDSPTPPGLRFGFTCFTHTTPHWATHHLPPALPTYHSHTTPLPTTPAYTLHTLATTTHTHHLLHCLSYPTRMPHLTTPHCVPPTLPLPLTTSRLHSLPATHLYTALTCPPPGFTTATLCLSCSLHASALHTTLYTPPRTLPFPPAPPPPASLHSFLHLSPRTVTTLHTTTTYHTHYTTQFGCLTFYLHHTTCLPVTQINLTNSSGGPMVVKFPFPHTFDPTCPTAPPCALLLHSPLLHSATPPALTTAQFPSTPARFLDLWVLFSWVHAYHTPSCLHTTLCLFHCWILPASFTPASSPTLWVLRTYCLLPHTSHAHTPTTQIRFTACTFGRFSTPVHLPSPPCTPGFPSHHSSPPSPLHLPHLIQAIPPAPHCTTRSCTPARHPHLTWVDYTHTTPHHTTTTVGPLPTWW